jgi:hypothetical protein
MSVLMMMGLAVLAGFGFFIGLVVVREESRKNDTVARDAFVPRPASLVTRGPKYKIGRPLLSVAERSFFGVLHQALGTDYLLFVKVRLADLVEPGGNASLSARKTAFNRIIGKHVDFVICQKTDVSLLGVIELDDKSHDTLASGFRDALVDDALTDAKIPILRVRVQHAYSPTDIRERVLKTFCVVKTVQAPKRPVRLALAARTIAPAQPLLPDDSRYMPKSSPRSLTVVSKSVCPTTVD